MGVRAMAQTKNLTTVGLGCEEHHGESIQGFGKELSEFEGNLSKLQTKVQGNTERDSEVSKNIEVIEKTMGKSSDRITSNTNAVEAVKVGW